MTEEYHNKIIAIHEDYEAKLIKNIKRSSLVAYILGSVVSLLLYLIIL